ncbi:uncharacterized protein EI90DRAFT_3117552 [Cantharellus anzutake]|uniref:uncharacterized protein n=1 Tax=Cantharellus anzutake TaxID=1750568 RepID=UPI001904A197|nr:uncharacterized protein EI90DRAFT_3117552 [Cantharellus anzutake]KAF8339784.1 hypothetical protein EI90DRAFT_3117552 [Cantharellus anzutake]
MESSRSYTTDTTSTIGGFSNQNLLQIPPPRSSLLLFQASLGDIQSVEAGRTNPGIELLDRSWAAMRPEARHHLDRVASLEKSEHIEFWRNRGGGIGVFEGKALAIEEEVRMWEIYAEGFTLEAQKRLSFDHFPSGETSTQDAQLDGQSAFSGQTQEAQIQDPLWDNQISPDQGYFASTSPVINFMDVSAPRVVQNPLNQVPSSNILTSQANCLAHMGGPDPFDELPAIQQSSVSLEENVLGSVGSSPEIPFEQISSLSADSHPFTTPLSNRELQSATFYDRRGRIDLRRLSLPPLPLASDDDFPLPSIAGTIRRPPRTQRSTSGSEIGVSSPESHPDRRQNSAAKAPSERDSNGARRPKRQGGFRWVPYDANKPKAHRTRRAVEAFPPKPESDGEYLFDLPGSSSHSGH